MKTMRVLLCVVLLMSGTVLAGGLVTNTNQSAAFMRTLNRNASTDVDAVYFNPAGLTKLCCNGLFIDIANQSIWQKKTVDDTTPNLNEQEFVGNVQALVFPTVYVAYKMNKLVLSGGFMPIGGGGSAEYEDGLPTFEYQLAGLVGIPAAGLNPALAPYGDINGYGLDVYFKGSSIYYGFQGGISYKINDLLSISLGGRYVIAKNSYEGYLKNMMLHTTTGVDLTTAILGPTLADKEVDAKRTGSGITPIIGLNLTMQGLNIGIRYEMKTTMEMENDTKEDGGQAAFADGAKIGSDLPSQLAVGASYQMGKIKLMSDFNYYGNTDVDWDGAEANFDNGMEVGLAAEYALTEKMKVSLGGLYSTQGATDESQSDMDFNLDTFTLGGGLVYAVTPKIKVNLGALNTTYFEGQNATKVEKYNQTTFGFAFGVQVKL